MAVERQPLGDGTVHVGGPLFVANAGTVEEGSPANHGLGTMTDGDRAWALRGAGPQQTWRGDMANYPASPGVGSLQVDPILPDINYSATFPENGGNDAWKGEQPMMPRPAISSSGVHDLGEPREE